ncbi:hypothetical protein CQW23_14240 [Capsicum baccatum]|uniref:Uncharacterized protein n=1 Tax=Capsicum baccatum TaxID=33114 RepID=A0A2G2WIN4_CAPBA|nr:hypothetical protein CQW23_14240 [Capsicum baccatum]
MGEVQEESYAVPKSSYDQCPLDGNIIQASDMLYRMTKQSRAWHTRDSKGRQKKSKLWCHREEMILILKKKNHEAAAFGSGKMSMEDMMAKLLKGVEATNLGVTEVKNDLSLINQLVDSNSTAIKQLEQQLSQLSRVLNQIKVGTLPSSTVQNPRSNGSCMAITTRSGKVLYNPSKSKKVVDDIADNVINADCDDFVEDENQNESAHEKTILFPLPPFPHKLKKKTDDTPEKIDNRKQDKKEVVEKTISLLPPPFPQILKKKADDTRFSKFMTMLKQLTINVPLMEALE